MKVWTVVNQKGGVGKTTSAVSLAGCLSDMGFKVLLLDLDPQGSLTHYLQIDTKQDDLNLYDVFMASHNQNQFAEVLKQAICNTKISSIDVLPAHIALATLDKTMGDESGKGLVVKKISQSLSQDYDYIIVDCPPALGVLMVNGLVGADVVLMPTQTEHLALGGLKQMLETIKLMKPNLSASLKALVVPTQFDKRVKACIKAFADMRKSHQSLIWKGYIPVDTKFRDASLAAQPIGQYAPNARGSFAYQKLVNEVLKLG